MIVSGSLELAQYNMRRDYDPMTGRYLEADPVGLPSTTLDLEAGNWAGGDPALLGGDNPYAYALSDPVDFQDATGLSTLHTRLMAAIATGNTAALRTLIGTGALTEEQEALAQRTLERLTSTAQ